MATEGEIYEGDRFKVMEAGDHYSVVFTEAVCHTSDDRIWVCPPAQPGTVHPAYGILDEERGGYIAFTTSNGEAEQIVHALNLR